MQKRLVYQVKIELQTFYQSNYNQYRLKYNNSNFINLVDS